MRVKEKLESWALFDDLHVTNRNKRCRRERHRSSESLGSAISGFRTFPLSVRGQRSMAPCVARDRWHRAWPARDSGLVFDDLHGTNRNKRCRGERHGSSESLGSAVSGFRPVSVARDRWHRAWPAIDSTVRGPRSMAPCVARARFKCKDTK